MHSRKSLTRRRVARILSTETSRKITITAWFWYLSIESHGETIEGTIYVSIVPSFFFSRNEIHSFDYWNVRRCTWRGPRSKVPGYAACHVTGSDEVRPCTRRCSRSRCCSSPACSSPVLSSSSSPRCPRESNRVNACRWWATTVLFNPPPPTIVSTNPRETSSPFQRRFRAPSLFVPFPFSPLFELGCRELFSSSKVAVFFFFSFFSFFFPRILPTLHEYSVSIVKGKGERVVDYGTLVSVFSSMDRVMRGWLDVV